MKYMWLNVGSVLCGNAYESHEGVNHSEPSKFCGFTSPPQDMMQWRTVSFGDKREREREREYCFFFDN